MKFGLFIPSAGHFTKKYGLKYFTEKVEDLGFNSLWVSDHIIMPKNIKAPYPFAKDKKATWDTNIPWYDSIILLSMLSTLTKKIELGTAVLVLPLREPIVFAKQIATIDSLSNGRIVLGVGAGWLKDEFDAMGIDFKKRGKLLDELIEYSHNIWSGEPKEYNGDNYYFPSDFYTYPKPHGKIQFLIGGHSKNALSRVSRLKSGWLPHQSAPTMNPDELLEPIQFINNLSNNDINEDPLRDVLRINQSMNYIEKINDLKETYAQAGVTEIIVDINWDNENSIDDASKILFS